MTNSVPTWDDEVKNYFKPGDVACMRAANLRRSLDLGDYDSVVGYIRASERNKNRILSYLEDGTMPEGGRKWSKGKFNKFKAWVDADCPKS